MLIENLLMLAALHENGGMQTTDPFVEFLIAILAVTIIPLIAKKIRVTTVVLELMAGVVFGVSVLNIIGENVLLDFFAEMGLIYLMFLAGMELQMDVIRRNYKSSLSIGFLSFLIPFLVGIYVGWLFGFKEMVLFVIGIVFSGTSIAIAYAILNDTGMTRHLIGQVVISAAAFNDIISVTFLSMFVIEESSQQIDLVSLSVQAILLLIFVFVIFFLVDKIEKFITKTVTYTELVDVEVRLSFSFLAFFVLLSEIFGLHAIVGAFFAGILMGEIESTREDVKHKLESFGWAFFIPLFFFAIGVKIDLSIFGDDLRNLLILVVFIITVLLSKVIALIIPFYKVTGSWSGALSGSTSMMSKLSIGIAAAEIARGLGIIGPDLFAIIIFVALITTLITPMISTRIMNKYKKDINYTLKEDENKPPKVPIYGYFE